jgi:hypothetical protein
MTAGGSKTATPSRCPKTHLIQELACYKAEARGFSRGCEEQDWLEAESEIKERLGFRRK